MAGKTARVTFIGPTRLAVGTDARADWPAVDPVRELGTFVAFVSELCDRESEWPQVPRDWQWPGVDGLKADIANQLRHNVLRIVVVATVEQARTTARSALGVEDIEQDFARDGAEGRDDPGPFRLLRQRRGTSRSGHETCATSPT
jgi:hypothetical protein